MALQLHPNNLEDGELQVLARKLNLIQVIDNFCHLTGLPVSCSLHVYLVSSTAKCAQGLLGLLVTTIKARASERKDAMKKK